MEVDSLLRATRPAPVVRVRFLQALAVCTDLACVDLAAIWHSPAAGPWAAAVAQALDDDVHRALPVIDVVFGHGFCLRDAALVLWGIDHPALSSWDAFVAEVAACPPERFAALVGLGLAMRLDAHGLAGGDAAEQAAQSLARDAPARRGALVALMDGGDRVDDPAVRSDVLALAADLETLRDRLVSGLRGFGSLAAPPEGQDPWGALGAAALQISARSLPPDALAAFPQVTGRGVPAEDREALASAREVLFLCCAHLGEQCSFGSWAGRFFVYFEPPAAGTAVSAPGPEAEAAFAALASRARLQILSMLGSRGELYAQELVEATGLPQATVASHLSELASAGLVASERRGHRRYYAVVPEAGRRLAVEILRLFQG